MRIGKCRALAGLTVSLLLGSCTPESPPPVESESIRSTSQASNATTFWTSAEPMKGKRKAHAALKLADGRVLVVGTIDPTSTPEASIAELYSVPTTKVPLGSWEPLEMANGFTIPNTGDCRPALAQVGNEQGNGRVLVVSADTVWSVDIETNMWLAAPLPMPVSTCKPKVVALPNNRALILADVGSGQTFIYDNGNVNPTATPIPTPTQGTWIDSAVTVINDEKNMPSGVLISGGRDYNDEAVLFDAMNDTWETMVGNMFFGRYDHAIALLSNNSVLVAGGKTQGTNDDQWSNTAEIFNLTTRKWTPTTKMGNYRTTGTRAVQLPSGSVLVVGGSNSSTAELFDPSTSHWSLVERADDTRYFGHEATVLDDGRVLVTGGAPTVDADAGNAPDRATDATALCDALAFTWEQLTPLDAKNRVFHSATKLADGRMLIVGGRQSEADPSTGTVFQDAWIYDPSITDSSTNPWSSVASTDAKHALHTATLLQDKRVLVVGGTYGALPELFDSSSNTWTKTSATNAPTGIAGATATLLNDGKVLIVGGYSTMADGSYDKPETKVYLYNPTDDIWINNLSLPDGFAGAIGHSATLLTDGSVLVVGGFAECPKKGSTVVAQNGAARFNPTTMKWDSADSMELPRAFHSATLLANGHVALTGGGGSISDSCIHPSWDSVYTSTLIYERSGKTGAQWTYAGTMTEARTGHQAVLLDGGRLLVAGGIRDNFGNALSSAEVFDTTEETWTSTSRMRFARYGHTLVTLDGGVVALGGYLLSGGSNNNETAVERFPQAELGDRCTFDAQCKKNICDDGVCCDMVCKGPCLSCTKSGYPDAKLDEGYCEDISGCSPYACVVETGACGMTCTDVDGCATGFVCGPTGECIAPYPNASKLDETGCAAAPTESNSLSWFSLAAVAGAYALRRRMAQRKS